MAIKRTAQQSNTMTEQLAEGKYKARLVYVADLGIQKSEWQGEDNSGQEISLGLEILGETRDIGTDGNEEIVPNVMFMRGFKIYQAMTERGNEYKRYKAFNPDAKDGEVADWDAVLGTPVMATLKHNKGGYAEIVDLAGIPEEFQAGIDPMLTTDQCTGDVGDESNPAQKATWGLARWCIDNNQVVPEEEPQQHAEEAGGGDDINPYN